MLNRLGNIKNPHQGDSKKVLCVCSAGLLRSPTAAVILSQEPYNFNTRAAGISQEYALIPVDQVLLEWADEIVCMDGNQAKSIKKMMRKMEPKPIINLKIPDIYEYRDPELIKLIKERYPS